jgi:uncharacterized SAM-binding protein YcdF (DUF218 family)
LFRRGDASYLVATGTSIKGLSSPVERDVAAEAARIWRDLGVPGEAIVTLPGPRNTKEELAAVADLMKARGWRRIGLVTSAWHLPRAMALARGHGIDVVALPSDYRGGRSMPSMVYVVPSGTGFENVHLALWERLGRAVGR